MGNTGGGFGGNRDRVDVIKDPTYAGENAYALDLSHLRLKDVPPDVTAKAHGFCFAKLLLFNNCLTSLEGCIVGNSLAPSLMYLRHLDVSCNALTELPVALSALQNLEYLDVGYNSIDEISDTLVDLLTEGEFERADKQCLKVLIVRYNQLTDFPNLHRLVDEDKKPRRCALERLDLSGNQLTEIPDLVRYTNLKMLHLDHNLLKTLEKMPDGPGQKMECQLDQVSPHLEHLDLSYNLLERLPLKRLALSLDEELKEREKEAEAVAKQVAELMEHGKSEMQAQSLARAWLREKEASETDKIRVLGHKLRYFNMQNQSEEEQTQSVFDMIFGDPDEEFEEDPDFLRTNVFYSLHWASGLTTLSLSRMQLVDDSFYEPEDLKAKMKDASAVTKIPEALGELVSLTHLDLSCNKLQEFPVGIAKMRHLRALFLQDNQLVKADAFATLTQLEVVDLSYNQLIAIPVAVGHLKKMIRLLLQQNKIRMLPDAVAEMHGLQELDISSNRFTRIPKQIGGLHLQRFCFNDNERLTDPPVEIQAQGPEATLAYLRSRMTKIKHGKKVKTDVLHVEKYGNTYSQETLGSIVVNPTMTLHDAREEIDEHMMDAPERYIFVHFNKIIPEDEEASALAINYCPMIQLRDEHRQDEDQEHKHEAIPEAVTDLYQEMVRQLRKMHMHKKFQFTIPEGGTHQVFKLDSRGAR